MDTFYEVKKGRADGAPIQFERTYDSFWDILTNKPTVENETLVQDKPPVERIPNDNIPVVQSSLTYPGILLLALGSGLFGALHFIAWNFDFPTRIERIFWHTATITAVVSPFIALITIPLAQITVSSGDPQEFMADCLRLLREFSWQVINKDIVDQAYNQLEQRYIKSKTNDGDAVVDYKFIFSEHKNEPPQLRKQLFEFISKSEGLTDPPIADLNNHFIEDFRSLCDLMEKKGAWRLCGMTKTNVFPRKSWLPKWLNLLILFLASGLYCLSRLSLLALSLSCLRRMPKSVYLNTPWTKYIPSLGSMS